MQGRSRVRIYVFHASFADEAAPLHVALMHEAPDARSAAIMAAFIRSSMAIESRQHRLHVFHILWQLATGAGPTEATRKIEEHTSRWHWSLLPDTDAGVAEAQRLYDTGAAVHYTIWTPRPSPRETFTLAELLGMEVARQQAAEGVACCEERERLRRESVAGTPWNR